jgi:hypothetical protein
MNSKNLISVLILLSVNIVISHGQENETVLSAPENWKSEIIPFPLGFAQDIDLVGFEDIRFSPNWSDVNGENFWTYMFVWYIEKNDAMTEAILTTYFNSYYDGLMGVNVVNNEGVVNPNKLDETICLFVKTEEGFTGKMRVYDRFFSKNYIVLNMKVSESFCTRTNKQIILYEISPQPFDHAVWEIFNKVELKLDCE